jgi:N-acetylglucosaminyl-diphospho-decaprenol L-rhamnosyltransferase
MSPSSASAGRVAALVVEYHSGDALERCLRSLRDDQIDEIVVVDNGARDGVLALLVAPSPGVTLLAPSKNLGFGGGVNLAAANTDAELLLICNPDVRLQPGAIETLRACLNSSERVGAVGPALIDESGRVVQSARSFPAVRTSWQQAFFGLLRPSGRRSREYRTRNWSRAHGGNVDWVTGACLLVRTDAFREIGGFDDRYFLYVEEVDFCWRLRTAGWEVLYEPGARVTHTGAVSTSAHPYRAIATHHRSLWLFVRRTTSGVDRAALPLTAAGLLVRCGLACAMQAARRRRGRPMQSAVAPAKPDLG